MRLPGHPAPVIPEALRPGDTIGIIAPGSPVTKERLEAGCENLRRLGYRVFFLESILEQDLYFAGTHERRAWEIGQMFERDFVKAIICARGGYGCNHLLPLLDLDVIRCNPKMFVGYSDVTTLLTFLCDRTGLVTYHGPMVAADFAEATESCLPELPGEGVAIDFPTETAQIRPGRASGILYGGCLSMLAASLGTRYEIETEGTILFLEDVNTKPFQIDRMLLQMKLAGKFKGVKGIVFGEMRDCVQPGGQAYTLQEVLRRVLDGLDIPIGFGLRSGHVTRQPNLSLPIGLPVSLEVSEKKIRVHSQEKYV